MANNTSNGVIDNLVSSMNEAHQLLIVLNHALYNNSDNLFNRACQYSERWATTWGFSRSQSTMYAVLSVHYKESAQILKLLTDYKIKDIGDLLSRIEVKLYGDKE
jgi:hypothetical protein